MSVIGKLIDRLGEPYLTSRPRDAQAPDAGMSGAGCTHANNSRGSVITPRSAEAATV